MSLACEKLNIHPGQTCGHFDWECGRDAAVAQTTEERDRLLDRIRFHRSIKMPPPPATPTPPTEARA